MTNGQVFALILATVIMLSSVVGKLIEVRQQLRRIADGMEKIIQMAENNRPRHDR